MGVRHLLLALLATLAIGLSCTGVKEAHADCKEEKAKCLPELDAYGLDGRKITAADLKGKVVLVNFWATWCKPCVNEIPALERAQEKYGPRGFVVIGVVSSEPRDDAQVQQFMADHDMGYTVLRDDGTLGRKFEMGNALPTTFLYDRSGTLVARHSGPLDDADLEKMVTPLLGAP